MSRKHFNPNLDATTVTGRMSTITVVEPQQNNPGTAAGAEIKNAFARTEVMLDSDYSTIEERVMAHMMGDPAIQEVRSMIAPARGLAAAAALGIGMAGNTFRPRPKRLPATARKVAPGLWMLPEKPKTHKGSKAAKKASRRGGNPAKQRR